MHSFDFNQVIHSSAGLFRLLNLDDWADEVEKSFEIESEEDDIFDLMRTHHLSQTIIMPSYKFQIENSQSFSEKMSFGIEKMGMSAYITDSVQKDPNNRFVESDFNITARFDKPYALLYSWDMHQDCTYGMSGRQIRQLFAESGWTGMTAQEFLVTQSRSLVDSSACDKMWTWLVDSSNDSLTSVGFIDGGSVKVYTCKQGSRHEKRGALVTHIIPLREVKQYVRE
ncbi:hypothetical protein [Fusibacter sp. JL216-2]|uniref:hypothetical protein n=1 Tax=Fusibacter sp. JL216-2 TaxID=3071453 RepID=UPI003D33AB47